MIPIHKQKKSFLAILISLLITILVFGTGMWLLQKQDFKTQPSSTESTEQTALNIVSSQTTETVSELGITYNNSAYQITYPESWSHKTKGNGDEFFFKGSIPSEADFSNSNQTSLSIMEPPNASDQGMCLIQTSEKTLTTKNGLIFTLVFNTNDKVEEMCRGAFDYDFVQVFIKNSLNKWMFFTYLPTDTEAEKDLENLLQSIKIK